MSMTSRTAPTGTCETTERPLAVPTGLCTLGSHEVPLGRLLNVRVDGAFIASKSPYRVRHFVDHELACEACLWRRHSRGRPDSDDYVRYTATVPDIRPALETSTAPAAPYEAAA